MEKRIISIKRGLMAVLVGFMIGVTARLLFEVIR